MASVSLQKRKGYLGIGGIGIAFGAAYLLVSLELPFGTINRPGAAIFPVMVGGLVMITGAATVWEGLKMPATDRVAMPWGTDGLRVLGVFGLLAAYSIILPVVGYLLSTVVLAILLMKVLSGYRWPSVVLGGTLMAVVLYVFFVKVFKVPLPRGWLAF